MNPLNPFIFFNFIEQLAGRAKISIFTTTAKNNTGIVVCQKVHLRRTDFRIALSKLSNFFYRVEVTVKNVVALVTAGNRIVRDKIVIALKVIVDVEGICIENSIYSENIVFNLVTVFVKIRVKLFNQTAAIDFVPAQNQQNKHLSPVKGIKNQVRNDFFLYFFLVIKASGQGVMNFFHQLVMGIYNVICKAYKVAVMLFHKFNSSGNVARLISIITVAKHNVVAACLAYSILVGTNYAAIFFFESFYAGILHRFDYTIGFVA